MDTPTLRGRTTRDGRTSAYADLPRAWRNVARAVPEADALWSVLRAGHPELPERPWKVEHTQTWQNGDATYFVVWDETQASETMPEIDEGMLLVAAERHTAENPGIGCECGFGVWSVEHVVVMAYREAKAVAEAAPKPQYVPSEGDRVRVYGQNYRDTCTVMDVDLDEKKARGWTDDGELWFPFHDLDEEP